MALSIDVVPVPTDEAVREVERRLLGVETNITNWTRRQNANMNYNVAVPLRHGAAAQGEPRVPGRPHVARPARMMFTTVTLVHFADTPEGARRRHRALLSCARKHLCRLRSCASSSSTGCQPRCHRRASHRGDAHAHRNLAVLMPFRVQEIMEEGGITSARTPYRATSSCATSRGS